MSNLQILVTKEQFHLTNGSISYIFAVDEGGLLSQQYFGKALKEYHGQKRYPRIDRGFSGNLPGSFDRGYSKDSLLQEYSSYGTQDFHSPALMVRDEADGNDITDFRYEGFEILAGKPALPGLPASYVLAADEAQTLVITLKDVVADLRVRLFYTIYQDYDVIIRSSSFENHLDHDVTLLKIASMQLDLSHGAGFDEVISLPGAHVRERQLNREKITFGTKNFESRRGTSSHQMNSFIALVAKDTNEHRGKAIGLNFVYSGNHKFEVEQDQLKQKHVLVGINDFNFSWRLASGETFQTPEVIISYSEAGLNGMSDHNHRLLRERVARGKHQFAQRPILVNNWEATYFDFDTPKIQQIVDEAADLGIEMFVLDDGWFGKRSDDLSSLGDWQEFPNKLTTGLVGLADYVHQKGLKFGLWFEPEMISFDSTLFQEHPDYLFQAPGRPPAPARNQYVLDMGRKPVRDHICQQMGKILSKVPIDYVKWDMNRHLTDIFSQALPKERQGEASHRYVLGLYEMLEELTTAFPDILWEGCSGGGGRFDAGFMYYMPQTWTSDNTDAVARLAIQYGTTLAYPVSNMTAHVSAVPNHQTGRVTTMKMRGDVAMAGVLGYELDLTQLTPLEKATVKEQIQTYQKFRQLVQYGKFIRLDSPFTGNKTAWMFVSPDQREALVFIYHTLSYAQPYLTETRLAGLASEGTYQDTKTGAVFGGDELMYCGFYDEYSREDFSSQVRHFQRID